MAAGTTATGTKLAQGPQGDPGEQGPDGEAGAQGPPGGVGASVTALYLSIVDIAAGAGLAGILNNSGNKTRGIGFGAIQAGHYCTGARFYWAGPATTLTIDLWSSATNTSVATVNVAVTGTPGIYTVTFATPYLLTAGLSMGLTVWDTAGASGHYTTYNGTTTGTAPLRGYMPASSGTGTVVLGPFVSACGYGGSASSADGVYGLTSTGHAVPTNSGTDTAWNPIEPMVA